MMKFYFYGDSGVYNQYHPGYVLNQELLSHIIFELAKNNAYVLNKEKLKKRLNVNEDKLDNCFHQLLRINAVDEKEGYFKLNFTVFLEEDILYLKEYLKNIGIKLGNRILSLRNKIDDYINRLSSYKYYSKERLLYHVICDQIFDGLAFDFFGEKKIFCVSKKQPDNRDYIIFGYEDCDLERSFSNQLLCSSNNYFIDDYTFNSFGDSNGNRCDIYRYFRLMDKVIEQGTPFKNVNQAYLYLNNKSNQKMMKRCGEIIETLLMKPFKLKDFVEEDKKYINFLIEMNYLKLKDSYIKVNVPVFNKTDLEIIKQLSDFILNEIYDILKQVFMEFEKDANQLTPIKHHVDVKEVANELWHQIFGLTNQYLIDKKYIDLPIYKEGEGRYLKSFIINKCY